MAPKLDEIVAGVEAKAQALLDADEDGKLSVEDARKLAISSRAPRRPTRRRPSSRSSTPTATAA